METIRAVLLFVVSREAKIPFAMIACFSPNHLHRCLFSFAALQIGTRVPLGMMVIILHFHLRQSTAPLHRIKVSSALRVPSRSLQRLRAGRRSQSSGSASVQKNKREHGKCYPSFCCFFSVRVSTTLTLAFSPWHSGTV